MAGATSAEVMSMEDDQQHGQPVHDLDAAHGLVPAIVLGAAFWAIFLAVAVLLWGCEAY